MAELTGVIVFDATEPAIQQCLAQFTEETPATVAMALLRAAGVQATTADFPLFFDPEDGVLFTEASDLQDGWYVMEPFGEEWLEFLQVLARSDTLRFWARLWHEHGVDHYIAVSGSRKLLTAIDDEDGDLDDEEIAQIEQSWQAMTPEEIRPFFEEE